MVEGHTGMGWLAASYIGPTIGTSIDTVLIAYISTSTTLTIRRVGLFSSGLEMT